MLVARRGIKSRAPENPAPARIFRRLGFASLVPFDSP